MAQIFDDHALLAINSSFDSFWQPEVKNKPDFKPSYLSRFIGIRWFKNDWKDLRVIYNYYVGIKFIWDIFLGLLITSSGSCIFDIRLMSILQSSNNSPFRQVFQHEKWTEQSVMGTYTPNTATSILGCLRTHLVDQANHSSHHAPEGQSMNWRDVHQLHAMGELWRLYNLCKHVRRFILGGNLLQQDIAFFDQLLNKMKKYVDMLGAGMMNWICSPIDSTHTITVNLHEVLFHFEIIQYAIHPYCLFHCLGDGHIFCFCSRQSHCRLQSQSPPNWTTHQCENVTGCRPLLI